jgi:hypothetical protein
MNTFPRALLLALAVAFTGATTLHAQDPAKNDPPKQEQKQEPGKEEPKKEEPKKDPKIEEYEKAIKDLTPIKGEFTFYQRKKEILLELPESQVGKLFLLQATFNKGASTNMTQAGDPVGDFVANPFRFEQHDDNLWLIRPNVQYRWNPNDPLAIASQRSLPEAVLGSYKIEQTHPEKKLLLVNVTQLFYGDPIRLNEFVNMGVAGNYMLDAAKSGPASVKSFPENAVVRMNLYYASPRGQEQNSLASLLGLAGASQLEDSRSMPMAVTFNMWYRKDTGYKPRLADPRVGYFTNDFYSVDRFLQSDRTERYIYRFHLEKKDPNAAMSEPVKPIVWYIDTSVPKEYRQACKDGILRWNAAFEKIGYKNAIVVKDAPTDDPDWDHADGRFNVFRWTMSPDSGYAIALARTDPFTGEVLNASVTVDANMLSFAQQEQQDIGVPSAEAYRRALSVLTRNPKETRTTDQVLYSTPKDEAMASLQAKAHELGWNLDQCRYAEGARPLAEYGWNAYEAVSPILSITREEYARQFLRDVVSHEVGHTLGLRHNFISSTNLTTAQLGDDDITAKESIAASVMDYTPANIVAILKGKKNFYAPTIGRYDFWAIEYGYKPISGNIGERPVLGAIAAKSSQPGLAFMTDENADNWDPYVVRFDCAKDPLAYSAKMIEAAKHIRSYAVNKMPTKGDNYAKRTTYIMRSINSVFREGRYAARFVGGVAARRDYAGSGVNTLAPVDPSLQRQAIRLIASECLSPSAFDLPESVLMNLSMDQNSPTGSSWTAPLREQIGLRQTLLIAQLLSASTTDRIDENVYKWGNKPGAYTIDEHYRTITGAVFDEIEKGKNVPALRRDLQRYTISALITQAGAATGSISEDARMLASDTLRKLAAKMTAQLKNPKGLDSLTVMHLRDSKEQINRYLARSVSVPR